MKQNLIIRASAGTGKTFSLATRFIGLMVLQDAAPERILALTFSRAAAQEIYMKLLERLWKAALSDQGAAAEREILCAKLTEEERTWAAGKDFSRARFAEVLRCVIAVQHRGTIATLDSFILRIVRSFPLEMGFQNVVDVLDGFGETRALAESRAALMAREDEARDFMDAYKTVTAGQFVRTCSKTLDEALSGWRDFAFANRQKIKDWTPATMRAALGVAASPQRPDATGLAANGNNAGLFVKFVEHVNAFTVNNAIVPDNKMGEMVAFLIAYPDATVFEYETEGGKRKPQHKVCDCGEAGAEYVRAGVKYMLDLKLGHIIDVVAAKLVLCRLIEHEYDETTRRRGQLTFADFTDCQAVAEDSEDALLLENLQFRMDSQFDHWALDEFQDTSELQWKCLKRLVREAAQPGGGRTVMTVGDLKQSIYTWRGGNDAPFTEMMDEWGEFRGEYGEIVPNAISYRYEKNTADFINRVFGPENIREGGVLSDVCTPAINRWLAENCWMPHEPDQRNGRPKDGDYVEVIAVPKPEPEQSDDESDEDSSAALKILMPKICDRVADLWEAHEASRSTETIGILVRGNKDGAALAEELRARHLPVVWEGMSAVMDAPAVKAVLQLLWLSEHPQDRFAWKVVNDLFPVRKAVFPELTHPEKVSQEMSGMLSRLGLSRALKDVVVRISSAPDKPDPRSIIRLEGLVREAVAYERRAEATAGMSRFIDYLLASAGREVSNSPHVIRILTIHRSKGLTLDHVIVPIVETGRIDSIVKPRRGTPLFGEGWALSSLPEDEVQLNPQTAAAWREAANERVMEQLRLNYVALTRARKSTHVFICEDEHGSCVQFRDLLLKPFEEETPRECPYGKLICEFGTMPPFQQKTVEETVSAAWIHAPGDTRTTHRSPSTELGGIGRGGRTGSTELFAAGSSAAERGTSAHADFAAVGWIDPAAPKNETERWILAHAWRSAFVRTPEMSGLWRERSYELFDDGVWETGQFDRVVFWNDGTVRKAVIYDFKTNAKQEGETLEAFQSRLKAHYQRQMDLYAASLSALTGLPLSAIEKKLLLAATGTVLDL